MKQTKPNSEFDEYATDYDRALDRGISVSGEDKAYFASGRIAWLARSLGDRGFHPRSVMDFGCGTGSTSPLLAKLEGVERVIGTDESRASLALARHAHLAGNLRFASFDECEPSAELDLVYCNGVFHHIQPSARSRSIDYVRRSLRPGGLLAFWENNPWNPGARYVMSRIPFDRDAVMISPSEARRLLRDGGFEILGTTFVFVFPHWLRWGRALEPYLASWPLGAQYQVLARRL